MNNSRGIIIYKTEDVCIPRTLLVDVEFEPSTAATGTGLESLAERRVMLMKRNTHASSDSLNKLPHSKSAPVNSTDKERQYALAKARIFGDDSGSSDAGNLSTPSDNAKDPPVAPALVKAPSRGPIQTTVITDGAVKPHVVVVNEDGTERAPSGLTHLGSENLTTRSNSPERSEYQQDSRSLSGHGSNPCHISETSSNGDNSRGGFHREVNRKNGTIPHTFQDRASVMRDSNMSSDSIHNMDRPVSPWETSGSPKRMVVNSGSGKGLHVSSGSSTRGPHSPNHYNMSSGSGKGNQGVSSQTGSTGGSSKGRTRKINEVKSITRDREAEQSDPDFARHRTSNGSSRSSTGSVYHPPQPAPLSINSSEYPAPYPPGPPVIYPYSYDSGGSVYPVQQGQYVAVPSNTPYPPQGVYPAQGQWVAAPYYAAPPSPGMVPMMQPVYAQPYVDPNQGGYAQPMYPVGPPQGVMPANYQYQQQAPQQYQQPPPPGQPAPYHTPTVVYPSQVDARLSTDGTTSTVSSPRGSAYNPQQPVNAPHQDSPSASPRGIHGSSAKKNRPLSRFFGIGSSQPPAQPPGGQGDAVAPR